MDFAPQYFLIINLYVANLRVRPYVQAENHNIYYAILRNYSNPPEVAS